MRAPRVRVILRVIGPVASAGGLVWLVFTLQPFGDRGATSAAIATAVGFLWAGLPARLKRWVSQRTEVGSAGCRTGRPPSRVLALALTAWLGLIAWSALCPGGPAPTPKADPGDVRVV